MLQLLVPGNCSQGFDYSTEYQGENKPRPQSQSREEMNWVIYRPWSRRELEQVTWWA